MQLLSTSGSLSFSHTTCRGAASCTCPFIVIAIGLLDLRVVSWPSLAPQTSPNRLRNVTGPGMTNELCRSYRASAVDPERAFVEALPCGQKMPPSRSVELLGGWRPSSG